MNVTTFRRTATLEVKNLIVRAAQEVLSDPDFSMELDEGAKRRLRKELAGKQKTSPLSEIKEKYS